MGSVTDVPTGPLRPFPAIEPALSRLMGGAQALRVAGRAGLWVYADPFDDPNDPAVFASVVARQDIDRQKWLIRGVLREAAGGPPILTRVAVEHLGGPDVEVTGAIVRDVNFATIRDAALAHLRRRADVMKVKGVKERAGLPLVVAPERARQMEQAAKRAAKARGPRGAYTPEHYHQVARNLLRLQREGRRTLDALCELYGKQLDEEIHPERMRGWIKQATKLKFLAPGKPGVAKREPGPNYKKGDDDG
jgi:hypothetical protein